MTSTWQLNNKELGLTEGEIVRTVYNKTGNIFYFIINWLPPPLQENYL